MMTNKMMIQKILLIKRNDCNCLTKTLKNIWEERGHKAIENELKRDKTKAEEIERILNMMIKRIEKEIKCVYC